MPDFILQKWMLVSQDVLVKSSCLLLLALLLSLLLRRSSAAYRHLVWLLALLSLLLLPLFCLLVPPWRMVLGAKRIDSLPPPKPAPIERPLAGRPYHQAMGPVFKAPDPARAGPALTPVEKPVKTPWLVWSYLFWLAGVLVMLTRWLLGLCQVKRLQRLSHPAPDGPASKLAVDLAGQMALRRPVPLRLIEVEGITPLTYGFRHPVVLLPARSVEWPIEQGRAALLHELAHIQRNDWLWQRVAQIVLAFYWLHPLVWLAVRRLRIESEAACDDAAVLAGMPASVYARQLLAVMRTLGKPNQAYGGITMGDFTRMQGRVQSILAAGRKREAPGRRARMVCLVLALFIALPLAIIQPVWAQDTTLTVLNAMSYPGPWDPDTLMQAGDGNFYGSTARGGTYDNGTIFQMTPDGTLTVLHSFTPGDAYTGNQEGYGVRWKLVEGPDGCLYGAAELGGPNNSGAIFKITKSGDFTVLYDFPADSQGNYPNGQTPMGGLILASDGNFYGSTGGGNNAGVVFKITPAGAYSVVYAFNNGTDGDGPTGSLVQAGDGNFYGTTNDGGIASGAGGYGTVFKLTPQGVLTTLYNFTQTDGRSFSGLTEGMDGAFYGTTEGEPGNPSNWGGTIFRITSDGDYTTIHSFSSDPDGLDPSGGLIQGSDGFLYGVTVLGGITEDGVIYRITTTGVYTKLYSFSARSTDTDLKNADGSRPYATPTQGSDGNLYVEASEAGPGGGGTIVRLDVLPDLLLQNLSTGQLAEWYLRGTAATDGAFIAPHQAAGWNVVAHADLNGDGWPDIVFQNFSTGQLAVWFLNRTQVIDAGYLNATQSAAWNCVGSGDFNGDGLSDLLFQNRSTGELAVWYMQGANVISASFITPTQNLSWKAVGVADFNGDGYPDILFQNFTTGQMAIWYMNGSQAIGGATITPRQSPGWTVAAVTDLNGDAKPDILFQNPASSQLAVWFMNGSVASGGGFITKNLPAGWTLAGPR